MVKNVSFQIPRQRNCNIKCAASLAFSDSIKRSGDQLQTQRQKLVPLLMYQRSIQRDLSGIRKPVALIKSLTKFVRAIKRGLGVDDAVPLAR